MIQDKPWRTQCWALWILLSAAVLLPRPVSTLNSVSSGLPFAYNHSLAEAIARKIQWIGLLAHPRKLSNDQDDGAKDVARQHLESHFAFLQTGLLRAQQGHKLCVLEFNIGAVQAVIRKVLCALAPTQVAKCDRAKSTANVHGEVYALIQEMLGAVSLLYANRLEHKLATSAFPLLRRIVAAGIFQVGSSSKSHRSIQPSVVFLIGPCQSLDTRHTA